jgi:hypothetical protein
MPSEAILTIQPLSKVFLAKSRKIAAISGKRIRNSNN